MKFYKIKNCENENLQEKKSMSMFCLPACPPLLIHILLLFIYSSLFFINHSWFFLSVV